MVEISPKILASEEKATTTTSTLCPFRFIDPDNNGIVSSSHSFFSECFFFFF